MNNGFLTTEVKGAHAHWQVQPVSLEPQEAAEEFLQDLVESEQEEEEEEQVAFPSLRAAAAAITARKFICKVN